MKNQSYPCSICGDSTFVRPDSNARHCLEHGQVKPPTALNKKIKGDFDEQKLDYTLKHINNPRMVFGKERARLAEDTLTTKRIVGCPKTGFQFIGFQEFGL